MAAVKEKRVEDSMIEQVHKLRPTHMNGTVVWRTAHVLDR